MSYNLPRILNNLSYEINNRDELTFINGNELHKIPIDNTIKIYSKNNSNIYKLDDTGLETILGSGSSIGGGDVYGPNSSVDNAVAFFDGTSGKFIKENTGIKYQTGFLITPDIETSYTFSLNGELDKIKHISSDSVQTTIESNLLTNSFKCDDILNKQGSTRIELTDTDINISATELTFNGYNVIDEEGKKNIISTLTTTQNEFTLPQELITKAYVDDLFYFELTKTQNISASPSITDFTGTIITDKITFTNNQELVSKAYVDSMIVAPSGDTKYITSGDLITNIASSVSINNGYTFTPVTTQALTAVNQINGISTRGFGFTLINPITINRIGVPVVHALISSTIAFKIYLRGVSDSIHSFTIPKISIYNGYYIANVSINLASGNYRLGVVLGTGDKWYDFITLADPIDSRITSLYGCWANSDEYPGIYGTANSIQSAMFWIGESVSSSLNVQTINNNLITTSSLICPEIKTLATEIGVKNNINMNSNNLTNVGLINGSKVYTGRVYCETSTFAIAGQVSESNLIMAGIYFGSISIPSNTFSKGDTFLIKFGGKFSCIVAQTFTLNIRLNFISAQPQLPSPILASFNFTASATLTSVPWNVEAVCSLRDIGATAIIFTDARFSYFDASMSGVLKGVGYNASTIINTTIENKFTVTYATPNLSSMLISNILINKLY